MFGKFKRRKLKGNGNLWVESEGMSGAGVPDTNLEQEEKDKKEEDKKKKNLKENKVIEVSVNNRKGERKKYYEAMVKLEEESTGILFYIDDRVATITLCEEQVDTTLAALEDAGFTDYGIYDRQFNPNDLGK